MWRKNITNKNSIIGLIITHLEFLGYSAEKGEDNIYIAEHPNRPILNIVEPEYPDMGFIFGGRIMSSQEAKNDLVGYLRYVNELNCDSGITRFLIDVENYEKDLVFQAWYPGFYDKQGFSIFMDFLTEDVTDILVANKETEKYLAE